MKVFSTQKSIKNNGFLGVDMKAKSFIIVGEMIHKRLNSIADF